MPPALLARSETVTAIERVVVWPNLLRNIMSNVLESVVLPLEKSSGRRPQAEGILNVLPVLALF
jgi:hypothetical protein